MKMMMESEAAKRICPRTLAPTWNEDRPESGAFTSGTGCIGSLCMAWVAGWETTTIPVGLEAGEGWEKSGPESGVGGGVTHRQAWRRPVGRCGLVLQP